jgi:hypothetical protein
MARVRKEFCGQRRKGRPFQQASRMPAKRIARFSSDGRRFGSLPGADRVTKRLLSRRYAIELGQALLTPGPSRRPTGTAARFAI